MITETGIARPKETLPLGQLVRFHHLACEMRLPQENKKGLLIGSIFGDPDGRPEWVPTGARKGFQLPRWDGPFPMDDFGHTPFQAPARVNKTVAVWPQEGTGIVVSIVRKGIGESVSGYESGYETPEWEPGYFVAKEWVWLYVIKQGMGRMDDFLLAPTDAVAALPDARVNQLEKALRWLGRNDADGWVREKVQSVLPKGTR
jgi:hypothetical protein